MSMTTQQPAAGTDPRNYALIVWILFLSGLFTAFVTTFIGFVIAVVKRPQLAGTPFGSHMTYAVRTFVGATVVSIGAGIAFMATVLQQAGEHVVVPLALATGGLMMLVFFWSLFRMLKGLILALDGRAVESPEGWL